MARASANAEGNALIGMTQGAAGTYTGACAFIGLNATDPGTTGAAEIAGGAPAYSRVAISWGTYAAGSIPNNTSMSLNVPTTTTVAYFSTWGAISGVGTGGVQIGGALNASVTFNSQGVLTIASGGLTLTAS